MCGTEDTLESVSVSGSQWPAVGLWYQWEGKEYLEDSVPGCDDLTWGRSLGEGLRDSGGRVT